jgi:excisionase family DNA binding protein
MRQIQMSPNANPQSAIQPEQRKPAQRVEPEPDFEPLLDVAEAAKLLRIHPKTLRAKARLGIIPAVQVGKLWRFRASVLNEWLEKIAS